jgi:hypothetical protein
VKKRPKPITHKQMLKALDRTVELGFLRMVLRPDGLVGYLMTDKGRRHVDEVLNKKPT